LNLQTFFEVNFNGIYMERPTTVGLPKWPFFLVMPWFSLTTTVHATANLLEDVTSMLSGEAFAEPAFAAWQARWRARLDRQGGDRAAAFERMRLANPAYIPRNHQVEAALTAGSAGDLAPMHRLLVWAQFYRIAGVIGWQRRGDLKPVQHIIGTSGPLGFAGDDLQRADQPPLKLGDRFAPSRPAFDLVG
jgi:hypothetical protein